MEYWSKHIRPTLITWKPSTSLSGETALQIFLSSMCSEKEIRAGALSHGCVAGTARLQLIWFVAQTRSPSTVCLYLPPQFTPSFCTEGTHINQSQMPVWKPTSSSLQWLLLCTVLSCQDLNSKSRSKLYSDVGEEKWVFLLPFSTLLARLIIKLTRNSLTGENNQNYYVCIWGWSIKMRPRTDWVVKASMPSRAKEKGGFVWGLQRAGSQFTWR